MRECEGVSGEGATSTSTGQAEENVGSDSES